MHVKYTFYLGLVRGFPSGCLFAFYITTPKYVHAKNCRKNNQRCIFKSSPQYLCFRFVGFHCRSSEQRSCTVMLMSKELCYWYAASGRESERARASVQSYCCQSFRVRSARSQRARALSLALVSFRVMTAGRRRGFATP